MFVVLATESFFKNRVILTMFNKLYKKFDVDNNFLESCFPKPTNEILHQGNQDMHNL